ncbi:hypothetical protein HPB51_028957 [Rhipicephalus microplus]|uniref:Uncharacterized protein n=1 Tax=Rhipicephalus microplus TaxID=6941 RepID=A0A9J6CVX0_RHIMP|nr:hypothetical protein HPB51_028957 [Rhipicephalus microplus]
MHAARLQLTAINLAHFGDSHHDLHRKQRLGSSSLLCTVPASDCERTTPTMLSDAEETLADTDKTCAIRPSSDPNASSLPITAHNNDQQLEESMDEDSTAFNDVPNTSEEHAYNGACWKVVRNKPRARNAAALEAASPLPTDSENLKGKLWLSAAQRLPSLLFRDEKVLRRPLGGIRLDLWPRPTLATAHWAAAGVSPSSYKKALSGKAATTTAITEHQQPGAWETNKAKAASRKSEDARADVLLRKPTTFAHGLPHYTATTRLLALGTHNTLSELLEAQWTSQRERQLLTPTGRYVLSRLECPVLHNHVEDTAFGVPPWTLARAVAAPQQYCVSRWSAPQNYFLPFPLSCTPSNTKELFDDALCDGPPEVSQALVNQPGEGAEPEEGVGVSLLQDSSDPRSTLYLVQRPLWTSSPGRARRISHGSLQSKLLTQASLPHVVLLRIPTSN